jgi:hypothetical protein
MNIKNLTKLLAVLAFCLGSSSMMSTAHAFHIRIDCKGVGTSPTWGRHTANTVTFAARTIGGLWTNLGAGTVPASYCDGEDEYVVYGFLGVHPDSVAGVRVSINGSDTLFIDQVILVDDDGVYERFSGADNEGSGRCARNPAQGGWSSCFLNQTAAVLEFTSWTNF